MPNNSIQFCHQLPELAETPQILGSVPQGCPTLGTSSKLVGGEDTCISDQPATDQRFPQPLSQLQQFTRMAHKIQENLFLTFTVGFFCLFVWPQCKAYGILVPQPGIKPPGHAVRILTTGAPGKSLLWFLVKNIAQESQVGEIHRPRRVRSLHALSGQVSLPDP